MDAGEMVVSLAWLCASKGVEVPSKAPQLVWREPEGEVWLVHDRGAESAAETKFRLVQVKGRKVA